jgi:hypothetical protein
MVFLAGARVRKLWSRPGSISVGVTLMSRALDVGSGDCGFA